MEDFRANMSLDKKIRIRCPKCDRVKVTDVSEYESMDKPVRFKCVCKCGHSFPLFLERRRFFRKKTRLPGLFIFGPEKIRGLVTVSDLSRAGVKFEVKAHQDFKVGDRIMLQFQLASDEVKLTKKEVIIKKATGHEFGAEFCSMLKSNEFAPDALS